MLIGMKGNKIVFVHIVEGNVIIGNEMRRKMEFPAATLLNGSL